MTNLISIILSVYKEPVEYVRESVESICAQTYLNWELIILVDDPSNLSVINYLEAKKLKEKRIILCINEKNLGLVQSLNKGLSISRGDYIARMDADDISLNNRLDVQLTYLRANSLDMVGSYYYIIDKLGQKSSEVIKLPVSPQDCLRTLYHRNCIIHPSWFAKRQVFEDLCGYRDIDFAEDYDFLSRAIIKGYRIGNCPQPLLCYRFNSQSISRTHTAEQEYIARLVSQSLRRKQVLDITTFRTFRSTEKYHRKVIKIEKTYKHLINLKQGHYYSLLYLLFSSEFYRLLNNRIFFHIYSH